MGLPPRKSKLRNLIVSVSTVRRSLPRIGARGCAQLSIDQRKRALKSKADRTFSPDATSGLKCLGTPSAIATGGLNSFGALLPLGPTIDPGPSGEDPDIVSGNLAMSDHRVWRRYAFGPVSMSWGHATQLTSPDVTGQLPRRSTAPTRGASMCNTKSTPLRAR